jgi:hypothetical protein
MPSPAPSANIKPVMEQEVKLANDEAEILKDAKASGVQLPEELYKDAGIN